LRYRAVKGYFIDWLAIEMSCMKQDCVLVSYPLLRIFTKQVRENGIDFQEVSW